MRYCKIGGHMSKQNKENDENALEKLLDEGIENDAAGEYVPNPLVSFEAFKQKKKIAASEGAEEFNANVFDGVMLLAVLDNNDNNNDQTFDLLQKVLELDSNPVLLEGNLETVAKSIGEKNIFGITDEDYERFLGLADKVYEKSMYRETSAIYQALVFLVPARLEGWLRWGQVESEHFFDYQKDVGIYKKCLKLFDHPAVHASLGICHVKGREFTLAEEEFKKAIELCDEYEAADLKQRVEGMLTQLETFKT